MSQIRDTADVQNALTMMESVTKNMSKAARRQFVQHFIKLFDEEIRVTYQQIHRIHGGQITKP